MNMNNVFRIIFIIKYLAKKLTLVSLAKEENENEVIPIKQNIFNNKNKFIILYIFLFNFYHQK